MMVTLAPSAGLLDDIDMWHGGSADLSGDFQHFLNAEDRGDPRPKGGKNSLTVAEAGAQIDRDGASWSGALGTAASVTYSFRSTAPSKMPDDTGGFSRFNAAQIAATEKALQAWADVANITFTRVGSDYSNSGQILFGNYSTGADNAAAFADYPPVGDVWVNVSIDYNALPVLFDYGRQVLLHEIGHAIGLAHPGDYDASIGTPTYAADAEYYEDTRQYSAMSYWASSNTGADLRGFAASPQLDDIAAAQRLYGANMTTRTGDTVYGFNSNAGRDYYTSVAGSDTIVAAIWDAGGTDTLDFSGYTVNQTIDLRQGHFSSVGGALGNIAIAIGAVIENAVGDAASDVITGNASANLLTGNGGTDGLYGLDGDDVLVAGAPGTPMLIAAAEFERGSQATAMSVNGYFTLAADWMVDQATTRPHATVRATARGEAEWYHVTVTQAGTIQVDMDNASFDTVVALFDANGNQLISNDDASSDSGSNAPPGENSLDSRFDIAVQPGDYYIRVTEYDHATTPSDGAYTLQIAVPGAAVTPAGTIGSTLSGGDGNDSLTGNSGIDTLLGGAGNDSLMGGGGADLMYGGSGDDLYFADQQSDLIFELLGDGYDSVTITAGYYLFANIEALIEAAGAGDIYGVGNDLANTITGNEGANLLLGGGGDDAIHGNAGGDQLYGESGADTLFGDAGVDYLIGGAGDDVLDGGADEDGLYGEDGNDVLWGGTDFKTDILVGGAGDDVLHGNSGLGEYDAMDGGAGNDAYYVDTFADLTFEAAGGGTDTVYADVGAASGYYLYANVENLVLAGTSFYGVGNELANTMTGNAGANWLLGGAGNDVLNGKAGDDVLFGQDGTDTFVFEHGAGGDTIADFLSGTDKIDLSAIGFASYQDVVNSMHEVNGTTAIDLGGGDFIVLQGVAAASLHQGDFILSGGSAAVVPAEQVATQGPDDTQISARDTLIHKIDPPHMHAFDTL